MSENKSAETGHPNQSEPSGIMAALGSIVTVATLGILVAISQAVKPKDKN